MRPKYSELDATAHGSDMAYSLPQFRGFATGVSGLEDPDAHLAARGNGIHRPNRLNHKEKNINRASRDFGRPPGTRFTESS